MIFYYIISIDKGVRGRVGCGVGDYLRGDKRDSILEEH